MRGKGEVKGLALRTFKSQEQRAGAGAAREGRWPVITISVTSVINTTMGDRHLCTGRASAGTKAKATLTRNHKQCQLGKVQRCHYARSRARRATQAV